MRSTRPPLCLLATIAHEDNSAGRVYTTDHDGNAIRRCNPRASDPPMRVEVLVRDERLC